MSHIVITKKPEIVGFPEDLARQFIGLRVGLSSLPFIGWLGQISAPAHFYHHINEPFSILTFDYVGHTVSIEGLITACNEKGGRSELRDLLKKMRDSGPHCEYFIVAPDWCEYEP